MLEPDRRADLEGAKLAALVRDRWGVVEARSAPFPGGAALGAGGVAWVLVGDDGARRLGGALAWARQQSAAELHVLAEDPIVAGILARRAAWFSGAPTVWRVDGRTLSLATPAPVPTFPPLPPAVASLRSVLVAAGLEVVAEQGELLGEVDGLEVARVVADADSGARIEVGVGRFDREAFAMMNAGLDVASQLAKAADEVRRHRRAGGPRHPLNQLCPERRLRAGLVADPSPLGLAGLVPVESALARDNLRDPAPATALGTAPDGSTVVVVCSFGVDLDLVPTAGDDRAAHARGARVVLALPERDVLPVTEALAVRLDPPADLVTVPAPWADPDDR